MGRGRQCLQTFRTPPVPCRAVPVHVASVWKPHPHRLCGSHTRAVAVPQQHIVAVEKPQQLCWLYKEAIYSLYKVYMPVKQARIRPENIDSGTNGVGKPPFGLKLCVVRAVHLRMPPACLDCQKTGPRPHRALFSCGCDALRGGAKHSLRLYAFALPPATRSR